MEHGGAQPKDRDEADKRIISDFVNRKSKFINRKDDVGGYPKVQMVVRPLDIPKKILMNG